MGLTNVKLFHLAPGCTNLLFRPNLETHLTKVKKFFDSGTIVELLSENLAVCQFGDAACMVVTVRYSDNPQPGVRASFFLEKHLLQWKIRHIHFSTNPNEVKT